MPDPEDSDARAAIEARITDANRREGADTELSPSGRYRLVVTVHAAGSRGWDYSRGRVWRVADGLVICEIKRNYPSFHRSFVVKDHREYLIAGRSYMSQTIVDLDRGVEYEPSSDQYNGSNFCWAACTLSPDGRTLAVDGCHWGGAYEFRFYDFTDPALGWPELPIVFEGRLEHPSDNRPSRWLDATTFEAHQADFNDVTHERTRLERRGDAMVVTDHWVSDEEQARRDAD
jgi:hypothetical protein